MRVFILVVFLLGLFVQCGTPRFIQKQTSVKYFTYDYCSLRFNENESDTAMAYKYLEHKLRKIINDTLIIEYRTYFNDSNWFSSICTIADTMKDRDSFLNINRDWYSLHRGKRYKIFSKTNFSEKKPFIDSIDYQTYISYVPDHYIVQKRDTIYILKTNFVIGNNDDNKYFIYFDPKIGVIKEDNSNRSRSYELLINYKKRKCI